MEQSYQISWYAPNFINMCIDNINDGELSGRIYHCYSKEPWKFTNILQLIELADDFFDRLEFHRHPPAHVLSLQPSFQVLTGLIKYGHRKISSRIVDKKGLSFSMSDTARIHPGRASSAGLKVTLHNSL